MYARNIKFTTTKNDEEILELESVKEIIKNMVSAKVKKSILN